jgi:capsular polysaccharide biosynthesis protein
MSRIQMFMVVGLVVSLGLSGCSTFLPAAYRANAIVKVGSEGAVSSAIKEIDTLAIAEKDSVRHVRAQHYRDTDLIGISVTAESANVAADACNRIASAYVSASNGEAHIIEKANPPKKPIH